VENRHYRRLVSITVAPYSAGWPDAFRREANLLEPYLSPWLSDGMEHIGSTAIPGLAAKPVLDMLAPVSNLLAAREAIPALAEHGYQHADHRPEEALWFYKQAGDDYELRTHQLHLTRPNSRLRLERLGFRDALREDACLRDDYAALKSALSNASDLRAYTDGKRAFVSQVLASRGIALG